MKFVFDFELSTLNFELEHRTLNWNLHYLPAVSHILHIDTAVQSASICISDNDSILYSAINPSQKDHASWLHQQIRNGLSEKNLSLDQIKAVAVSAGPGSYTGLRVGMATAKGLCYALKIPLVLVNTLQLMANAAKEHAVKLLCPMIDARRMEVFTAIFDHSMNEVEPYKNLILDQDSFKPLLEENEILFFGNGSTKFQSLTRHPNAVFATIQAHAEHMPELVYPRLLKHDFADLAYAEPFYGKDFHSFAKQSSSKKGDL